MTQYANPELTIREQVQNSIEAVTAMIAQVDATKAAAAAHLETSVDKDTALFISQHINMQESTKYQLNSELTRLQNIVAVWNGDEPQQGNTFTPMLPTTPGP
jgi:DNA-binding ferritin-like protein